MDRYCAVIKNLLIMFGIVSASTLAAVSLSQIHMYTPNQLTIFVLGVLIVSIATDFYIYGILASLLSIVSYNFFFSAPVYSFASYGKEHFLSFGLVTVVAVIANHLTIRLKNETNLAKRNHNGLQIIYAVGHKLMVVENVEQVAAVAAQTLSDALGCSVLVVIEDKESKEYLRHVEKKHGLLTFRYFPIVNNNEVLGALGIAEDVRSFPIDTSHAFLETIASQIALCLDREYLIVQQNKVSLEMEYERFRGNMLRAISHDLRTPLTSIMGSSSILLENHETLDTETKIDFLQQIYDESQWLNQVFDNILYMTRFEDGCISLNKQPELMEELISSSVSIIQNRNHAVPLNISITLPNEPLFLQVDGILIEQVLINLLDNAVKYADARLPIRISADTDGKIATIEIADSGCGVPEDDLAHIFERFFTKHISKRSMGLGLPICKAIVEAHDGKIFAVNDSGLKIIFTLEVHAAETAYTHR